MSKKTHVFKVRAVIFDMDGVITDTMAYHMRAWKIVFARHGISVEKHDIYKREGQKGIDSVKEIFNDYKKPFVLKEAKEILLEKEILFKKIVKKRFISGVRAFLKTLKRHDFKMALVTGTARHEVMKILPEQIFDLFDAVVCGCEVQNGKPHPEPYLKALSHLDLKPHQAVVIENAPFGIQSARAAGMRCIAIETSLPRKYLSKAHHVFHSFDHLTSTSEFQLAGQHAAA